MSKSWDGNTSDTRMFQERAQPLMNAFKTSPSPRYLIADAKLNTEENAANLRGLGFSTRMANTIGLVSHTIKPALTWDICQALDETTGYQGVELCHDGMAQRWLVVDSPAALQRAEVTIDKAKQRDYPAIEKPLFHWRAKRLSTSAVAQDTRARLAQGWPYHRLASFNLIAHKRYAGKGRPMPSTPRKDPQWQIQAHVRLAEDALGHHTQCKACFVPGTNFGASELSETAIIAAYKRQSRVEGGFRCLNDSLFFVSSLFVKSPCRIQGLLMVMTLAWLVYSVAQRRLRQPLVRHQEAVQNPINPPTASPFLRCFFKLLDGIHRVQLTLQGQVPTLIEGLNDLQMKVLHLFREEVYSLYQLSSV